MAWRAARSSELRHSSALDHHAARIEAIEAEELAFTRRPPCPSIARAPSCLGDRQGIPAFGRLGAYGLDSSWRVVGRGDL